ncbi:MAG: FAD-dependent thymidylate synthase [Proteobacteria bacterium]|nr:FAD-dependent thymidylate synthase [Candidatus Enterousia onthequi]
MSEIKVTPIAETNVEPTILASHAARMCYTAESSKLGDVIDVKKRLFDTGHHSTLEHNYWTFMIENIPVSSVVFGLHLTAPFYDTDQRSGRFSKMYDNPDMADIKNTLETYYPGAPAKNINQAYNFIERGLNVYADNIQHVTELARDAIRYERPNANDKYVEQNAPKFAQEQLRMFVSMIAPTALDWTVDLATICAFYRTAWTPFMRDVMDKIVANIKTTHPDIAYMFDEYARSTKDWTPEYELLGGLFDEFDTRTEYIGTKTRPDFKLLDYGYINGNFVENKSRDTVDTLQFSPEYMDNSLMYVRSRIHVDAGATMGQDQRHRSIKRSKPTVTGYFYLPPLLDMAGLKPVADTGMRDFYNMVRNPDFSRSMVTSIMPYGAMVQYEKHADLNALIHEQGKRTCWCAQEAIYHLACDLRRELAKHIGENAKVLKYLTPPCLSMGKCVEGPRYCGRNLRDETLVKYFRDREI